jgi:hypothetical protein
LHTHLIINPALLLILQDVIGLIDLLELVSLAT